MNGICGRQEPPAPLPGRVFFGIKGPAAVPAKAGLLPANLRQPSRLTLGIGQFDVPKGRWTLAGGEAASPPRPPVGALACISHR